MNVKELVNYRAYNVSMMMMMILRKERRISHSLNITARHVH